MEGQERSAVKVHPGGVIRIPVQMHLHPRIHKLAEIVGGKNGGAGIAVLAGKGSPLKGHGKQAEINGVFPIRRDQAQDRRSRHINKNGPAPQIAVRPPGQPCRQENSGNIDQDSPQPQQCQRPVFLRRAGQHFQQIHGGRRGKMPEPQHHIRAEPAADHRHAEMQPLF